jgi:sorting nexin-1/2
LKSPTGRGGPRTPIRRVAAKTTTLAASDDGLGPLGPLGENAPQALRSEQPPAPPQKEQSLPTRTLAPSQSNVSRSTLDTVDLDDDSEPNLKPRIPPPVQPSQGAPVRRDTQPSVSVEQAAKPSFEITVGDPHKVGDITSSHIVYQVRTKVCLDPTVQWLSSLAIQTSSKAYKLPEFSVSRRYRDFLWLYTSLHANNPGVVVPPPPEKQAVGRFDSNFVESRRMALERMLNKIAAHPTLQHDGDLKIFLESEAFNMDVKHKERKEPGLGESKGMFASLSLGVGSSGKFVEQDDVSGCYNRL